MLYYAIFVVWVYFYGRVECMATNSSAVEGGFGPWGNFTTCSVTCGRGEMRRTRRCNSPIPQNGGKICLGPLIEIYRCNEIPCPVNGRFGEWSNFTSCSKSCGGGEIKRTRNCDSPKPQHGGQNCTGDYVDTAKCNQLPCPIHGGFGLWSNFTPCSKSCGGGEQLRVRKCDSPKPQHGGQNCTGIFFHKTACNEAACPVDGVFGSWSNYTACSKSCGGGAQVRSRQCDSPRPMHGGRNCSGKATEQRSCNNLPCPVDGAFGSWSNFTSCTKSCGGGEAIRTRRCDSPSPKHGGKNCTGSWKEKKVCNVSPCPVHGGWGTWSSYATCKDDPCNDHTVTFRSRKCDSPVPQHRGSYCAGEPIEFVKCKSITKCPVHGVYGNWTDFGACSSTCGWGLKRRARKCDSPAPKNGGRYCQGPNGDAQTCKVKECPVDGSFGQWSQFTACSKTCGAGWQSRSRKCDSPSPAHGGKACVGDKDESKACEIMPCKIDGDYGPWTDLTSCSVTCGDGMRTRMRRCNSPTPQHGGKDCAGNPTMVVKCNLKHCPIDGGWSAWSEWSKCYKKTFWNEKWQPTYCFKDRTRKCNNPWPRYGGKRCPGKSVETPYCRTVSPLFGKCYDKWTIYEKYG